MSEPAPARADGDHYREMAGKLRELAHTTQSPGLRRELVDLAKRYDRRGDYVDGWDPGEPDVKVGYADGRSAIDPAPSA